MDTVSGGLGAAGDMTMMTVMVIIMVMTVAVLVSML